MITAAGVHPIFLLMAVIGIVTGLVNPTKEDVFIGIGLAVPINVAGGAAGLPLY